MCARWCIGWDFGLDCTAEICPAYLIWCCHGTVLSFSFKVASGTCTDVVSDESYRKPTWTSGSRSESETSSATSETSVRSATADGAFSTFGNAGQSPPKGLRRGLPRFCARIHGVNTEPNPSLRGPNPLKRGLPSVPPPPPLRPRTSVPQWHRSSPPPYDFSCRLFFASAIQHR